jgi:hypothetical protein
MAEGDTVYPTPPASSRGRTRTGRDCWRHSAGYSSLCTEGGGIFSDGTVTVENSSSITGNILSGYLPNDAENLGVLDLDSTSKIGVLAGNPAISH